MSRVPIGRADYTLNHRDGASRPAAYPNSVPTVRRARTGLLAAFPPFVLLERLFVSPLPRRTCTADVTHEGRDSRDQVDLPEQTFGYRQGPTEATLGGQIAVAHRGYRDEAEVHVVASLRGLL